MRSIVRPLLFALLALAAAGDEPVDLGKVLRESKEFKAQCARYRIEFSEGLVSAVGEIVYRGGGPCEYLVSVFPTKGHETIVLLDDGPPPPDRRRPRRYVEGLATNLNNAFLAAGFKPGTPLDWDPETGEVFPPKGETVHIYAEWKDGEGSDHRAPMHEWVWNHKRGAVMQPGRFVYTGSVIYDDEDGRKWLGAEMDGLVVAILATRSAIVDHVEDGGLENGAYEAIAARIPPSGTRVKVVFSRGELPCTEKYPPVEPPKEEAEEGEPLVPPKEDAAEAPK
jgi:hypothetical protein